ncbi:MAG TPA: Lpg1974 family pore-forming outer membrane protein, partial [Gemmataceae bacterium]|nr:Lpg1974 family pore-forming outer membrane protein [Gemmataceae bacterium]
VSNQLMAPVAVGNRIDTVAVPNARLNATAAPRFELGYRLGQGAGEIIAAYRFVETDGSATFLDPTGNPGNLRSRFSMNVMDLDYASHENSLLPNWDMRWRIGARVAGLYFDSQDASPAFARHVVNSFWGGGPHASLELWRTIVERKFSFMCRLDGAGVFGNSRESFAETSGGASGFLRQSQFMPSTMLNVQAGFTWTPSDALRFSAGYTYENWWDAAFTGGFNSPNTSRGDVWTQGLFLRGEWRY